VKLLLTGASSFTGWLFARELAAAGHELVATFRRADPEAYTEQPRAARVRLLKGLCTAVHGCSFGDERFLRLIAEAGPFDALCHHGAEVTDYRSPDFDVPGAIASNVHGLPRVADALQRSGCHLLVWTGTFFEGGEGAGSDGLPHASPYGLSKALSAQIARYAAERAGVRLAKFVIPNPFGPYEEARFTTSLVRSWYRGETPRVLTPAYVRDNIHGALLALCYAAFVERSARASEPFAHFAPSGYVETQGAFAQRFAAQMQTRLGIPCPLELAEQTSFPEPRVRINTDAPDIGRGRWDEAAAWDELAQYYREALGTDAERAAG
jgi:UDP-glucose 4-epimerase